MKNVAETAKHEARNVTGEARNQLASLYSESMHQLNTQATAQQERASTGLKSLSGEFRNMVHNSEGDGLATELVRRAADTTGAVGSWLGDRNPSGVLNEVRSFARRKPFAFIAIAAVTGLVAGRLTRSIAETAKDEKADEPNRSGSAETTSASVHSSGPGTSSAGTSDEGIANDVPVAPPAAPPAPSAFADARPLDDPLGDPRRSGGTFPDRGTGI